MFIITIPLKHIIIDAENPVDLSVIAEKDAIDLIKKSYGFLSSAIDVSIQQGVAIIQLQEQRAEKITEAVKHYQKGVRDAQQGAYDKAIKSFEKVLAVIPQHIDARRNLAMAYLEKGNISKAKELLHECIKIDPTNVWSFVLLGNIATKHDRNFEVAAFYYEKGLSINPGDNILINNFAALSMEMGNVEKARELFEKALTIDASYPNTYFGLALLHRVTNNPEMALKILEQLFQKATSTDVRSVPIYKNARSLYLEICTELARKESDVLMQGIMVRKIDIEKATGHPISIELDNSLEYISAVSQMAWKHNRDEHRIRYRMRSEAMTPHLVIHELEHIILEHEARQLSRNRFFTTTAKTREHAIQSVADHVEKLQRQGYSEEGITNTILKLTQGLSNQIFNCPLDMVVENNIYNKYPELRHSQFASLHQMHLEALQTFTHQEIKKFTPPRIFRASVTLNCAYSLFIDYLYHGLTDYASAYRTSDYFAHGQNLFEIWKRRMKCFTAGDEYEMVDEYADILKLRSWYDWKTDPVHNNETLRSDEPALSAPLTTEKPEAYTFCLDALKRFDGKSRDEIFNVISEISMLGINGIDYTTPGKTYTLKSLPEESFVGLHLLCLMYVGFKLYDPAVNCGLDFADAYKMALDSKKAVIH